MALTELLCFVNYVHELHTDDSTVACLAQLVVTLVRSTKLLYAGSG